jgi:hypothetical protein
MYELKMLSKEAIPAALQKAERYRLLGEPYEAESICLDILQVEPDQQEALIMLLLALTDEFETEFNPAFTKARELLDRLGDAHCRAYYSGIISERRAKAHLTRGGPAAGQLAYQWLRKAMADYELALTQCSPGNQDALLRWNTCARILNENPHVTAGEEKSEVELADTWE